MLDLDPRLLGAVSTSGVLNIGRPESTVSWSKDNQVALVTEGGGILVLNFVHTYEELTSETVGFTGEESKIPCTGSSDKNLETYTGISLSTLLRSKIKSDIFDIVRDGILCPKEITNAEVHLNFVKVEWSHRPLKLNVSNEGQYRYLLGALDSHFKLRMYIRQTQSNCGEMEGIIEEDEWKVCVDFTESYRNLLISQFWKNTEDAETTMSSRFDEYKRRMYELGTVDFIWLPPWEETRPYYPLSEGDVRTSLITAHASGDICIWNICVSYQDAHQPQFFLTMEFRRKLVGDEIVSSLKFYKLSQSLGLFVVGTAQGSVKLFCIKYNLDAAQSLKTNENEPQPQCQKYVLDNETTLCDKDTIEVQNSCAVCHNRCEEGVYRVELYVFKHPNFVLPFELLVSENGITIQKTYQHSRVVKGTLTGAMFWESQNIMMILNQRGILSWCKVGDGEINEIMSHDLSQVKESEAPNEILSHDLSQAKESEAPNETPKETVSNQKKRLQFGGLIISPNNALFCVSKTLAEYYNHLTLRSPTILQFHSLFPPSGVWSFIYQKFELNDFYIHRITDVLAGFREIIKSSEDNILKEVLDWAVPLKQKTVNDLQVLFWFLRIQPRVDKDQMALAFNFRDEQPEAFLDFKFKQIRMVRRETLVLDHLMQLKCRSMLGKIIEDPEKYDLEGNVLNLQSLKIMYDFLETKTNSLQKLPLKPRVLVDPPPRKPACPLCGKATMLLQVPPARWKKDEDFDVDHPIDNEEFDGVLWHEQQHVQKARSHPITNCILSLVPSVYPYRKCAFCGTICMLTPSFGQDPLCPLCNGIMDTPPGFYTEEELEAESEKAEAIIKQLETDRANQLIAARNPPNKSSARKSRIENLFV